MVNRLQQTLFCLCLAFSLAACGSHDPNATQTLDLGVATIEIPAAWEEVENQRGIYSPYGDEYERLYIKVGGGQNRLVGPTKVRKQFVGIRDLLQAQDNLLFEQVSDHNEFEVFQWAKESKAPSEELIPAEYQKAGDQILHHADLITQKGVKVTVRMLVEVDQYNTYLPVFERMLGSVTLVADST